MLAYTTRGHGTRPALLLHGFLGSGRNLASLARRWVERDPTRLLVLPDLPGHGTSPPLPPNADLGAVAARVVTLCEALGTSAGVEVIGHSLGGRVALVARHLAPERIGAVTLVDIGPGPIPVSAGELSPVLAALIEAPATAASREPWRRHFADRGVSGALTDWLLMNLAPRPGGGLGWRIDRDALAAFESRTRGVDLWPALLAARAPTRCVRGGQSPFVADREARRLEDAGVPVHTVVGAGHFIHVDAQDDLLDIISSQ